MEGLDEKSNGHAIFLSGVNFRPTQSRSAALEAGDHRATCTNEIIWRDREHVVPRARCSPHLVVLQQIRIDEDTQISAVAEWRHAISGIRNVVPKEIVPTKSNLFSPTIFQSIARI